MNTPPLSWDLIILGGGAAGYFAACVYAQASKSSKNILILEKARKPLGKVRISGGGRCNVTNACFDPALLVLNYPRGFAELRSAFSRFQPRDTMDWFEQHGVKLKIESDGRVFPASDSSETIVNCLQDTAESASIKVWTDTTVTKVDVLLESPQGNIIVYVKNASAEETALTAHHILLTTGGDPTGFSLAGSLGHVIETPVPSLFSLKVDDPRIKNLAGVSIATTQLRLLNSEGRRASPVPPQVGPILITHWGLSGPAVLRLSAWGARWLYEQDYRAELNVNWLFPSTATLVVETLKQIKTSPHYRRSQVLLLNPFPLIPSRLWQHLVSATGSINTKHWADLSKVDMTLLAQELCECRLTIQGKGPFKDEFVTCGGIRLSDVDFRTMQSRMVPGLFFAGEILDIDGLTGGFNFQNAWTTAWVAGQAMAGV